MRAFAEFWILGQQSMPGFQRHTSNGRMASINQTFSRIAGRGYREPDSICHRGAVAYRPRSGEILPLLRPRVPQHAPSGQ